MKLPVTLVLLLPALSGLAQTTLTNDGASLTVTSGDVLYVAGAVQNNAGGTLTTAGTLQLTGDLTNAGTLVSSGTLLFSGAADQTLILGTATLTSLVLSNTGAVGANRLLLAGDLSLGAALTLTQGVVRTLVGSTLSTLSLPDGGRVVGEGPGQYVQGRLAVTRTSVSASTGSVDFTNGFVLNPNGQSLGPVTVTRTAGLQQARVSYGTSVGGSNKGIDRVWQVVASQPLSPTTPASATVSWVSDDDNGLNLTTPVQLWRAEQASGPWTTQGTPASSSARSFTANVSQLGVLTVSNTSAPLPVTLVAFTAERQGGDALLRWTTASELNNAYFQIESSTDGLTFAPLGRVAGQGTSPQAHAYQYTDASLARYATPLVYYRLRQVDTNGLVAYSPVRTVAVPLATGLLVQAYPNPSAPSQGVTLAIRSEVSTPATLWLTDVLGRQLSQRQVPLTPGTTNLPLGEAQDLATGVYLLRVQQGDRHQTLKLVRQ